MQTVSEALEAGYDWLIIHLRSGHRERHRLVEVTEADTALEAYARKLADAQVYPVTGVSVAKSRTDVAGPEDDKELFIYRQQPR